MLILSAGSNACGQLANSGLDDSHSFQKVIWHDEQEPSGRVKKIACGGNHTLVLFEDGQLWACGNGRKGQLGPISSSPVLRQLLLVDLIPNSEAIVIVDIAACWETSFIVLRNANTQDHILSMGANDYGDRGIGVIGSKALPRISKLSFESLFESTVNLASIRVTGIAAGPHHLIASLVAQDEGGQIRHIVAGWGSSRHGQLGESGPTCPSPRTLPLKHSSSPLSISVGNQHTLIVHEDGKITGFGSNKKSQLECAFSPPLIRSAHCTWNGTCLMTSEGELILSGNNNHGQLCVDDPVRISNILQLHKVFEGHQLQQVSAGSEHLLVHLEDQGKGTSLVLGWGWNEHGNLGLGHTNDIACPVVVWPPAPVKDDIQTVVESIWTGCGTSWIVLS